MAQHWLLVVVCMLNMVRGIYPDRQTNVSSTVYERDVSLRLLYGESHGISWSDVDLDNRLPPLLSQNDLHVQGLDYHYHHHWLYISVVGQIWRLPMNQTGAAPEVIVKRAGGATSVAVDWVQDRVYWLSPATDSVRRADLDGRMPEAVLDVRNISRQGNIVIDPYCRLMFVTLNVNGGGVLRAGLEESSRTRVTVRPEVQRLQEVVSLALDIRQKRLFLSSRVDYLPTILSCDYDGSDVRRYDLSDVWRNKVTSVGVLGEWLFWVHHDWPGTGPTRDAVWKGNTSTSGEQQWSKEYRAASKALDPNNRIWALKVYHPDVQMPPPNGQQECVVHVTDPTPPM